MPAITEHPTPASLGGPTDSELTLYKAEDLVVISELQRKPNDQRLRMMIDAWSPELEGILFVARITDGDHAGELHVYDGGTRWKAQMEHGDPEHIFVCWVKDMTEQEAAQAFIAFNTMSSRPHAYYQYQVGIHASTDWALAIQVALTASGLTAGQTPRVDVVAAITAMKRIVTAAHRVADRGGSTDPWAAASHHLAETLRIARLMQGDAEWPNGDCWQADFLQAIAGVLAKNAGVIPDENRWKAVCASRGIAQWVRLAQGRREGLGGSESRSNFVRYTIVDAYNRGLRASSRIRLNGGTPVVAE
jgi:hypothetical protein